MDAPIAHLTGGIAAASSRAELDYDGGGSDAGYRHRPGAVWRRTGEWRVSPEGERADCRDLAFHRCVLERYGATPPVRPLDGEPIAAIELDVGLTVIAHRH